MKVFFPVATSKEANLCCDLVRTADGKGLAVRAEGQRAARAVRVLVDLAIFESGRDLATGDVPYPRGLPAAPGDALAVGAECHPATRRSFALDRPPELDLLRTKQPRCNEPQKYKPSQSPHNLSPVDTFCLHVDTSCSQIDIKRLWPRADNVFMVSGTANSSFLRPDYQQLGQTGSYLAKESKRESKRGQGKQKGKQKGKASQRKAKGKAKGVRESKRESKRGQNDLL